MFPKRQAKRGDTVLKFKPADCIRRQIMFCCSFAKVKEEERLGFSSVEVYSEHASGVFLLPRYGSESDQPQLLSGFPGHFRSEHVTQVGLTLVYSNVSERPFGRLAFDVTGQ